MLECAVGTTGKQALVSIIGALLAYTLERGCFVLIHSMHQVLNVVLVGCMSAAHPENTAHIPKQHGQTPHHTFSAPGPYISRSRAITSVRLPAPDGP